jgi:hypothetical protein
MTDVSPHRRTVQTARAGGPNPGILAVVSLGLTVGGLISSAILTGGQTFVSPFAPAEQVAAYFHENPDAVRLASLFQFGSAVPLGIFTATVYALQLRLGVRVPGPGIGFFGGITVWMRNDTEFCATRPVSLCGAVSMPAALGGPGGRSGSPTKTAMYEAAFPVPCSRQAIPIP